MSEISGTLPSSTSSHNGVRMRLLCVSFAQVMHHAESSMINARNINGDTFLHILGVRWYALVEVTETEALVNSLISLASLLRFQFSLRNSQQQNAFATFIPRECEAVALGTYPTGKPWRVARILNSMLMVQDGGRFLSESLGTVTQETKEGIDSIFWELGFSIQAYGSENWIYDVRCGLNDWQKQACLIDYSPVPSLHTYLQHLTTIPVDLLDQGADPNEYNELGKTCLMVLLEKSAQLHFSESAAIRLIRILLDRGANLALLDRDGNSALHCAVSLGFPDVVQMLLQAGADPKAKNLAGKSATDVAVKHYEVARPDRGNEKRYAAAQVMLTRFFDASVKRQRGNKKALARIDE